MRLAVRRRAQISCSDNNCVASSCRGPISKHVAQSTSIIQAPECITLGTLSHRANADCDARESRHRLGHLYRIKVASAGCSLLCICDDNEQPATRSATRQKSETELRVWKARRHNAACHIEHPRHQHTDRQTHTRKWIGAY